MTKLSVNVNKVATLRNTRHSGVPSVVRAAEIALRAGAQGITVHPRPDQRHIRPGDVHDIAALLRSFPEAEFNIEGNPFHGNYLELARQVVPTQCTLVPDNPDTFTSNQGWDLRGEQSALQTMIRQLQAWGCRVSLFLDPIPEQVEFAARLGANRIELYTEPYATAHASGKTGDVLPSYVQSATLAQQFGLGVNAGHDLTRDNLPELKRNIPFLAEVSIGHALIADALEFGLAETVRLYLAALNIG